MLFSKILFFFKTSFYEYFDDISMTGMNNYIRKEYITHVSRTHGKLYEKKLINADYLLDNTRCHVEFPSEDFHAFADVVVYLPISKDLFTRMSQIEYNLSEKEIYTLIHIFDCFDEKSHIIYRIVHCLSEYTMRKRLIAYLYFLRSSTSSFNHILSAINQVDKHILDENREDHNNNQIKKRRKSKRKFYFDFDDLTFSTTSLFPIFMEMNKILDDISDLANWQEPYEKFAKAANDMINFAYVRDVCVIFDTQSTDALYEINISTFMFLVDTIGIRWMILFNNLTFFQKKLPKDRKFKFVIYFEHFAPQDRRMVQYMLNNPLFKRVTIQVRCVFYACPDGFKIIPSRNTLDLRIITSFNEQSLGFLSYYLNNITQIESVTLKTTTIQHCFNFGLTCIQNTVNLKLPCYVNVIQLGIFAPFSEITRKNSEIRLVNCNTLNSISIIQDLKVLSVGSSFTIDLELNYFLIKGIFESIFIENCHVFLSVGEKIKMGFCSEKERNNVRSKIFREDIRENIQEEMDIHSESLYNDQFINNNFYEIMNSNNSAENTISYGLINLKTLSISNSFITIKIFPFLIETNSAGLQNFLFQSGFITIYDSFITNTMENDGNTVRFNSDCYIWEKIQLERCHLRVVLSNINFISLINCTGSISIQGFFENLELNGTENVEVDKRRGLYSIRV